MGYKLKRITIRQKTPQREPGANTVAYFSFENDQLDSVGTATINATGTKETIGYRFDLTTNGTTTNLTTARFVNYWVKFGSVKADENQTPFIGYGEITYNYRHTVPEFHKTISYQSGVSSWGHSTEIPTTSGVWYNFAYGYDGTKVVGYLNGTKVAEITTSLYNTNNRKIGSNIDETLSNLIYETTPRTDQEVLDYYNQTKGNYGYTPEPTLIEQQIRPKVVPNYLCFTANTANSTVQLTKQGNPTSVTLEKSTNGKTWESYTIGSTITLTNIGDKIYLRNTSETDTGFGGSSSNYYQFAMSGSIAASGDIGYLLNKNSTLEASSFCFYRLFMNCTSLTATPTLPATTVNQYSYNNMFKGCTSLETLPTLPATNISEYCYAYMFSGCTKIKLSATQTGDYQTAYRMPATGTGTTGTGALNQMFYGTGGTFTSNPSVNTTYYTSNTVVS